MLYEIINTVVKFFPLQLLIAEFLFGFCLKKRPYFWLRFLAGCAIFLVGTYFIPYDYMVVFGWVSFKYIFLLALSIGLILLLFDCSWKEALFCGMAGYAVEHIAFSAMMIVRAAFSSAWQFSPWTALLLYFLSFAAIYALCWAFFGRRVKKNNLVNMNSGKLLAMTAVVVIITQVLSMWLNHAYPGVVICRIYAIFSGALALLLQFNFFREDDLKHRNDVLQQILKRGKEQYSISKENIDLINMKCHDIKKNIDMLLALKDPKERERLRRELETSVEIYDSAIGTGSEPLDILLMDKNLRCRKNGIKFTCMADGAALDFIAPSDLYSLLGNAIDNAIESVERESEENRMITLKTERRGELLSIHLENYSSVEPRFKNGLPLTTKGDKAHHGFGTQSMRYIAEKYGGTLKMSYDDKYFILDVLFTESAKKSP